MGLEEEKEGRRRRRRKTRRRRKEKKEKKKLVDIRDLIPDSFLSSLRAEKEIGGDYPVRPLNVIKEQRSIETMISVVRSMVNST